MSSRTLVIIVKQVIADYICDPDLPQLSDTLVLRREREGELNIL